jgi:hypothetical protein
MVPPELSRQRRFVQTGAVFRARFVAVKELASRQPRKAARCCFSAGKKQPHSDFIMAQGMDGGVRWGVGKPVSRARSMSSRKVKDL